MVQLPEVCDAKSEAAKAGFPNICEIGKERIRRAGQKLLEADDKKTLFDDDKTPLDIGFKVFKLARSNMELWDYTPVEDNREILRYIEKHINRRKEDRSDIDLVYEIILKMGYSLTDEVTTLEIDGLTIYQVANGHMLICLQPNVTAEHVEQMAKLTPKPQKITIAETAFADNSAMSNAHYLLSNQEIELKIV